MNIRSLTRGDGVVIGAAVVLFIASFLSFYDYDGPTSVDAGSAWSSLGHSLGLYMAGVIGAALIVVNRGLPQPRKVLGLDLDQVGTAFAVVTAWALLWMLLDVEDPLSPGAGLILGFLAALVLAAAAIATAMVPALKAPLITAPRPAVGQQQPYAGQQPSGYGYPGAQQQPYGGPAQPSQGGGQPQHQGQGQHPQAQGQQPAPAFSPFWFAVPAPRPLYAEDGSPSQIAELAPGTWYLAVDQRGPALIAQTQDGRRGVLQDTSGIQRG